MVAVLKLKKNITTLLFFFSVYLVGTSAFAQRLKANIALGASAYIGDLQKQQAFLIQPCAAATIGASYDITQFIRGRVDITLMGVRGDDKLSKMAYTKARNLNFRSNIWELAFLGEYDLLNLITQKQTAFTPYVFLGPGIFCFNPTTIDRNGNKVRLHNEGTEGQLLGDAAYNYRQYSLVQLNFQLGAGFKYTINDNITLGLEASYRKIFTDYLDDVHAAPYVNPADFLAKGQVEAAQLSFRGDEIGYNFSDVSSSGRGSGKSNDFYYTFQLKAIISLNSIHLGKDLDYYKFSHEKARRSIRNPGRM